MEHEETLDIRSDEDLLACRIIASRFAVNCGFDEVDQIRITTAVSEIVRNVLTYATRGRMKISWTGATLTVIVSDNGPGIKNIALAMQDGYSSSGSLGLGLPCAKRLMDALEVESSPGQGTRITMQKRSHGRVLHPPPEIYTGRVRSAE